MMDLGGIGDEIRERVQCLEGNLDLFLGYEEPDSITHRLSFSAKKQVVVDSQLSQPASDGLS